MDILHQVAHFWKNLLQTESFPARWHCGLGWDSFTGWFYILSDLAIWGAYISIPIFLSIFIKRLHLDKNSFSKIFWLFCAFIFACGTTHLIDALLFWWPAYRLAGLVLFFTAFVSWVTVLSLIPILPKALTLKPSEELEALSSKLNKTEERFRLIIETVRDYAIFRLDPNGMIETWNAGAERITGYSEKETLGQHFSRFYPHELVEANHPAHELEMASQDGVFEEEGWRIKKDGSRYWSLVNITAIYDENGNVTGFTKITRDLTEQRNAEEKILASERKYRELSEDLLQQSTQLATLNKELEAFSYSVSHDLRAPLRGIDGFSQALLQEYADKLDDRGQHYLTRVRSGSQQMGQLIDDMLQLSQLSRKEMNIDFVDLSEMAKKIMAELCVEYPARDVTCIVGENIRADGDKHLLHAALKNLLENSWKYTSKHSTATIEFGCMSSGESQILFVKDDGAGFDMRYAGKLFGAFQRLHGINEFSGTGVGLATVARIVKRHGGEIWAEAEIEKGATFYFTLGNVNRKPTLNQT